MKTQDFLTLLIQKYPEAFPHSKKFTVKGKTVEFQVSNLSDGAYKYWIQDKNHNGVRITILKSKNQKYEGFIEEIVEGITPGKNEFRLEKVVGKDVLALYPKHVKEAINVVVCHLLEK